MTREQHLLVILAEECSEVAQRVSKALRFGLGEIQPGQSLSNAERIRQEFGDLIAAFEMTGIGHPNLQQIDDKKRKVEDYFVYSQRLGCVEQYRRI